MKALIVLSATIGGGSIAFSASVIDVSSTGFSFAFQKL